MPYPLTALLLLTIPVAAAAADSAQAAACPQTHRARLLAETPEALLPCADAKDFAARAWAAHARQATGNTQAAAALLELLATEAPPALVPVLQLERSRALMSAGDLSAARAALPQAPASGWLAAEIAAQGARVAVALEDWDAVATLAKEALRLGADDPAHFVFLELQAMLEKKQDKLATPLLKTLLVKHPESLHTLAAQAATGARVTVALTAREYASRWRLWRFRGGASSVADECLPGAPSLSGVGAARARYECGEALSTLRRPEAEALLRAGTLDASVRPQALFAIARVRGRRDLPAPVDEICKELRSVSQASSEQAECEYLAAFLHLDSGAREQGRQALEAVAQRHPSHTRAADALWMLALDDLRDAPERAFKRFDTLAKQAPNAEFAAQALYWRGRVRHAWEPERAREDWHAAIKADPYGYYALLASSRLGLGAQSGACAGRHELGDTTPSGATLARVLLQTGFRDYAGRELAERVDRKAKTALEWASFLASAGQYERLLDIGLARAPRRQHPVSDAARPAFEAAYPLAFPAALTSLPESVDGCFILSLMRRESRYNPDAVSAAQARGLLQLLPTTATQAALELGLPAPSPHELFEPALNVRLAGHYVSKLIARFEHPFLAAAAYNGGPSALAKWISAHEGMEIDEFVERIPYRETRHYVKAVGGAWSAYGLVWANARPPVAFTAVGSDAGGVDY